MSEKYYVYYRKLGYASAPYPAIHVVMEDPDEYEPMDLLTVNGWTQTDYDWAEFDTWDDSDGETSLNEWWITPGTPPTASSSSVDNLSVAQRQAIKQGEIDDLIASVAYTQATDSKLTVESRAEFATYIEELRGISDSSSAYYQVIWATDPESVVLPAAPTEATDSTDYAYRSADYMGDNTITIDKTSVPDRETLLPEFTFDDGFDGGTSTGADVEFKYFWRSNCVLDFTPFSKSGGNAAVLSGTTGGTNAYITGRKTNAASVREGETYYWELDFRSHNTTAYTQALRLLVVWYEEDRDTIVSVETINTWDVTTSWQIQRGWAVVPTNARYATFRLMVPGAAVTAGAQVRIDSVVLRKVVHTEQVYDLHIGKLTANSPVEGDSPTYVSGSYQSRQSQHITLMFVASNIAASTTTRMKFPFVDGTAWSLNNIDLTMPRAGRVIGGALLSNAARTAGTATLKVRKNGTATALLSDGIVIDATNTQTDSGIDKLQATGTVNFAAGDTIGSAIETNGFWQPTTADMTAFLFIQFDPQ